MVNLQRQAKGCQPQKMEIFGEGKRWNQGGIPSLREQGAKIMVNVSFTWVVDKEMPVCGIIIIYIFYLYFVHPIKTLFWSQYVISQKT